MGRGHRRHSNRRQIGPGDIPPPMPATPAATGNRHPPLAVAIYLVCRNLVPVVGVLFLGWSARQQLVLYFLDTLLALTVLFALALAYFFPIDNEEGMAAHIN